MDILFLNQLLNNNHKDFGFPYFPKFAKAISSSKKIIIMSPTKMFTCLFIISTFLLNGNSYAQLQPGTEAPTFKAKASLAGKEFDFSMKEALKKGAVVLYFYPAAYTKGCDLEAHTFAELSDQFAKANATIIGISADNIQRLNTFSSDPDYCAGKFPVASDPVGKIAALYNLEIQQPQTSIKNKKGEEINHGFIPRTTFVIDKNGKIIAVFSSQKDKISPVDHVKKALEMVQDQ